MNRRWLLAAAGTLLFFVLLLTWLRLRPATSPGADPAAGEARVSMGRLTAFVEATGRLQAERQARLSLPVSGFVAAWQVEVGDVVTTGQGLLQLDERELQLRRDDAAAALDAAVAQRDRLLSPAPTAEIEVAQARLEAARLSQVVAESARDALPPDTRDESEEAAQAEQARAAVEQARAALRTLIDGPTDEERAIQSAQVAQARTRLALADEALAAATLRAPFDGTVIQLPVAPGERAAQGQTLALLAAMESVVVLAEVDEVDVGRVEAGQAVTVTLDAFPARPLAGIVRRVAPGATPQRAATTYETTIDLLDPPALPLRLDMAADLRIATGTGARSLLLPLQAIRYADEQPFVRVRRGQVVEQAVTLGARDDRQVEILDGLSEGEIVLLP